MRGYAIVLVVVVAAVCAGRGDDDAEAVSQREALEDRAVTATCANAIAGAGDPGWRRRSTVAWRFGLYGPGRDFRDVERFPHSALTSKIPAIVEGTATYVLAVPPSEAGNVGLAYGPTTGARRIRKAATQVTFEACSGEKVTAWPGGLLLKDRDPIKLTVTRANGQVDTIQLGRLP